MSMFGRSRTKLNDNYIYSGFKYQHTISEAKVLLEKNTQKTSLNDSNESFVVMEMFSFF